MDDPKPEVNLETADARLVDRDELDVIPTPTPRRDSYHSGLGMSWTPDDGHPL